jgi:hypothetical protein
MRKEGDIGQESKIVFAWVKQSRSLTYSTRTTLKVCEECI